MAGGDDAWRSVAVWKMRGNGDEKFAAKQD
jgi:hypothetical protein